MDEDANPDSLTEYLDPVVVRARRRLGEMLRNKWRLDALLGVGGMSVVFAATHRNGSRAAVKVLHLEASAREDVRSRFMREGYVANSVGHAGAVKILDDDVADDGSLYLVTELLDGETLEGRRTRLGGQLNEDEVLWVAEQVLDVLVAAHAKGIIHRDIKPENVFITRDSELKVLDFGIARLREVNPASQVTQAGLALGTPAFMSPEQARGEEVDARSDLWSVGATMFQALTGRPVHEGRTTNEQLLKAMTNSAPSLLSMRPGLSPAVCKVIDRSLAFNKDTRWLDARRMQKEVRRAYYDRHGASITTAPRLRIPESLPNRTLSSAPQMPTTGRPVANSWIAAKITSVRSKLIAMGAVAGILLIGIVASVVGHGGPAARVSASNGAPTTTALRVTTETASPKATLDPVPAVSQGPRLPTLPEVAATDLPIVVKKPRVALSASVASQPTRPLESKPAPPAPSATNAAIDDGF